MSVPRGGPPPPAGPRLTAVSLQLKLVMIVGIDCYHDTTAGRRSIAGFVASINEGMTR